MKYLFSCLLFLAGILPTFAQEGKDYKPELKMLSVLSLTKPLSIDSARQRLTRGGFKESPDLNSYFEQDLYHKENSEEYCKFFRKKQDGQDIIFEAQYLGDGRVYRLSCYINVGGGRKDDGALMMVLKIVFNNSAKKVVADLGQPTKYYQEMMGDFTKADYENDERCLLALRSNSLIQAACWNSKKYAGTEWANTPTVELAMHTLKMIRFSVTDIELLKLSDEKPVY